jgi:hypothetical protein
MTSLRWNAQIPGLGGIARLLLILSSLANASFVAAQVAVTTYHYDNYRTGWNSKETALTPASVGSSSFGLLATVTLDDQVDAQPLLVPNVNITAGSHPGKHDVVYVVTGNDTVYAISADDVAGGIAGVVLLRQSLGTPVRWPLGCQQNGPNVGITSTPVIDVTSGTLYVMAYTQEATTRAYQLHALDLGSLQDKVPPQSVTASHTLTNGTKFSFDATYERQRPGLLLANGNVYAGFGSFCDFAANLTRGWLLGWNATSLAPLSANQVLDSQGTSTNAFFMSSIWMSGYGLAADDSGNVVFATGNSDPSGTTYDGVSNIQESVVKVSSDLTTVMDLFTPSDEATLDKQDGDFGSGGVMVLPDQPSTKPHLAVAAGKDGNMYLMNEDHLGGYSTAKNDVLGTYKIGGCLCGESYFVDPKDRAARVVSSGARNVTVWKLQTSPSTALSRVSLSQKIINGQGAGFFTSVSSNGLTDPIIWAISRPASPLSKVLTLYAFNPESGGNTMSKLFQGPAGTWPYFPSHSNLVPVVANGKVYVASYKQLQIFGLKP